MSRVTRRDFVAAGAGALLVEALPAAEARAKLPLRDLGKTGVRVPLLGLGTVALGNQSDRKAMVALLNKAIDLGVSYIDTAPGRTRQAFFTGYGRAQAYVNAALKERRKEVFLVTKCLESDGSRTLELLRKNLAELGVERVDLCYTHTIGHASYDEAGLVADAGPMAALEKAKKDGLTRFVGVTGHNRPEKFARVLEKRSIDVMMNAVNVVDRHTYAFEEIVWPAARKNGVGLVAMKVFGGGGFVAGAAKMPPELREASLRYALSVEGVATAVVGMGTEKELEQNVAWALAYKPMTADEAKGLKKQTVALAREWGAHLDRLDGRGERSRPLRGE